MRQGEKAGGKASLLALLPLLPIRKRRGKAEAEDINAKAEWVSSGVLAELLCWSEGQSIWIEAHGVLTALRSSDIDKSFG